MNNPILQQLPNQNSPSEMLEQFKQFKSSMQGHNPKQAVINLLRQGKISNPQLQQLMQTAQQLRGILK